MMLLSLDSIKRPWWWIDDDSLSQAMIKEAVFFLYLFLFRLFAFARFKSTPNDDDDDTVNIAEQFFRLDFFPTMFFQRFFSAVLVVFDFLIFHLVENHTQFNFFFLFSISFFIQVDPM